MASAIQASFPCATISSIRAAPAPCAAPCGFGRGSNRSQYSSISLHRSRRNSRRAALRNCDCHLSATSNSSSSWQIHTDSLCSRRAPINGPRLSGEHTSPSPTESSVLPYVGCWCRIPLWPSRYCAAERHRCPVNNEHAGSANYKDQWKTKYMCCYYAHQNSCDNPGSNSWQQRSPASRYGG
ncbi:uncharacterized protein C8Q71DRAFT_776826 [Rhodofomes roseus]|uniref:Uncharacterized protein n=1 Tax=Rhodofomes roseus TaxID=34475 RepID=A0ABQ8K603_9APHY|nr:uncharacterized protein C8Q71DRAFT_776826 [Rhodofomes roseus]KAH9832519.1 hypothetical protein C8Q71DRAFT_776826 [Rhodofomes roseus]